MAVKFAEATDVASKGTKRGADNEPGFFSGKIDSAIDRRREFFVRTPGQGVKIARLNELNEQDLKKHTEEEYVALLARLRKERKCAMCSTKFTLADSLGRRECVWHSKGISTLTWRWKCCGTPYDNRTDGTGIASGCHKSDHYHMRYDPRNPIKMAIPIVVGLICRIPHILRAEEARKKDSNRSRNIREVREVPLTTQDWAPEILGLPDCRPKLGDRPVNHIVLLRTQGVL